MKVYILWRLLSLIPVMLVVAVVVFFVVHLTPGDPAAVILGQDATPEMVEKLRQDLGLDRPIWEQFINWFLGLFKGDLGTSIFLKQPVLKLFIEHLGPTLSLAILAQSISILLAIPMGISAARKAGTAIDQVFMIICLLGISLPSFLLGLLLSLFFGVKLGWLPVAGFGSLSDELWIYLKYLILPSISLGFIQAAVIARMTRTSMLDVLNMNYMKTAYAKGVKEIVLVYKHALRNAFIPILTVIGQSFNSLIVGAVVIETVFNIPGVGQLFVQAIQQRDFSVIQGVVLLIAISYMLINLLVDLLYGIIDPRVRLNRKS